jgi:hypothetical protein
MNAYKIQSWLYYIARKMASIIIPIAFILMILSGITLSATIGTFGSAYAQANATTINQTGKTTISPTTAPSKQASQSIRGAITDTGQFLHNASEKVAGSKSAQTVVNESSDVLGNATVATKKFISSK